jgi:hypothetical protein
MELNELSKEVLNSNLSDEAKIEVMKALFGQRDDKYVPPYQITYPYIVKEVPPRRNWWDEITCGDGDWWQQQQRNAQADVESIIHPRAIY